MAPLLLRLLAPTLAELRVSDAPGVLAVQEDVIEVLFFEVGAFEGIADVGFGEAYLFFIISIKYIIEYGASTLDIDPGREDSPFESIRDFAQ